MDKKIKAIAENTNHNTVNHADYNDAKETVEACKGCNKEFQHESGVLKCLSYHNPASKWPRPKVGYETKVFTVRSGKGYAEEELPVVNHTCPLASHVALPEIVRYQVKVRAGQGRTKQGGNR